MIRRGLAVVAVLTACDAGEKPAQRARPTPPQIGVALPGDAASSPLDTNLRASATGPFVVRYNCFHSNAPFGPGEQYRNLTYDLGASTVSTQAWETKGTEPLDLGPPTPGVKPSAPAGPPKPVVAKLPPEHVRKIEAAAVEVLHGGPYQPEYPVPEGTPCTLIIESAGTEVFSIEKAYTTNSDAPTRLVTALGG